MTTQQVTELQSVDVRVRRLSQPDLGEADRIFHLSFGTFLGLPNPALFYADRNYVYSRWRADPESAFAVDVAGQLVGSNFATRWGSVGYFGPLTIRPDHWDRGLAHRLLEPTMELFDRWGTTHAGLFTFAHSAKHIHLYQKFGFWPRFLTAIMATPLRRAQPATGWTAYSALPERQQSECLQACRELTDSIHEGLDLQREISAAASQELGDTILLWSGSRLSGFAVCHCGEGTEAGRGSCYVKFGCVRPGPGGDESFERLLDACESLALSRGLSRLEAGVNLARHDAYRRMLARGFRTEILGVAMERPNEPGYNRPDVHVIDDWR